MAKPTMDHPKQRPKVAHRKLFGAAAASTATFASAAVAATLAAAFSTATLATSFASASELSRGSAPRIACARRRDEREGLGALGGGETCGVGGDEADFSTARGEAEAEDESTGAAVKGAATEGGSDTEGDVGGAFAARASLAALRHATLWTFAAVPLAGRP